MTVQGSIASHFHEGTRSEYLAQYVFSALGTSIPVPHPEDSGFDLHCTLGKRIGHRLHVSNYFFVQVKSVKEGLTYEGAKAVEWLVSHRYPILLCYVNKKENLIEVYHTLALAIHAGFVATLDRLTLVPDQPNDLLEVRQNGDAPALGLGQPVLHFNMSRLADAAWIDDMREILQSWIELDQYNIDQRNMGFLVFKAPLPYQPNEHLPEYGFLARAADQPLGHVSAKYYDSLFRLLAAQVRQAMKTDDARRFEELFKLSTDLLQESGLDGGFGFVVLATELANAAGHFKYPKSLEMTDRDGTPRKFPSVFEYSRGALKT